MTKETFELIDRIAKEHSKKEFGYLTQEDLRNEIWVICLDIISSFTKDKGELENFLRVSVKNRLINKFKDITKTVRSPCPRCPYFKPDEIPDCAKFGEDKYSCKKWKNYTLSVSSRNSLLNASEQQSERSTDDKYTNYIIADEMYLIVKSHINPNFLYDFEKLHKGENLTKNKLKKLKIEIDIAMSGYNYEKEKRI